MSGNFQPVQYPDAGEPCTDDPVELAVIDAMFNVYMGCLNNQRTSPDPLNRRHFWKMAKYIHLPEMARSAIATVNSLP